MRSKAGALERGEVLVDPEQEIAIHAEAVFSDGTRRDVTRLAVYEPANQLAEVTAAGIVKRLGFGENTVTVRYLDQQVPVRLAFVPARKNYAWRGPEPFNDIDKHIFAKLKSLRINPAVDCYRMLRKWESIISANARCLLKQDVIVG